MLKLYVCVACEKVIIDQDGVASLIGLFNKFTLTLPKNQEIPKNAVAPKEWAVFSAWDTEPGDELKEHLFCLQIFYPDKSQFGEIFKNKMKVELNKRSQVKTMIPGFPVGRPGFYTVRNWIEESNKMVAGPIEFKMEVEILKQEPSQN